MEEDRVADPNTGADTEPTAKRFARRKQPQPLPLSTTADNPGEARLRHVLDRMAVGVLLQDTEAAILVSNQAALHLLGLTEDQLLGKTSFDPAWNVIHEDGSDFPGPSHPVPQAIVTRQPVRDVVMGVFRPALQDRVWLLVNADPELQADGSVAEVVCTFSDITERKRTEETLRRTQESFREARQLAHVGDWELDLETEQMAWSEEVYSIFGFDPALPPPFADYRERIHPEDVGALLQARAKAVEEGQPYNVTVRLLLPDETQKYCQITGHPVYDENGRIVKLAGKVMDITERKMTERALRRSNKRITNILSSITDAFLTLDRQWVITFVNPRAEQMLQQMRAEMLNRNFWEVFPPMLDSVVEKEFRRAMAKQSASEFEAFYAPFAIWLQVHAYPSQDGLSVYMRDITGHKGTEEELRRAVESMRRSVDGIVNAMSFLVEIRDPFTGGHQKRVSVLAVAMARELEMSSDQMEVLRIAGLLHDVGKVSIPAEILSKPVRLSEPEMSIIRTHPEAGYAILKGIEFPPAIALSALQHHERLDGSGYPGGLLEEAIIPEARILAVADVVEAMASHRPYRPALGVEMALEEILRHRGAKYWPEAVDACLRAFTRYAFDFEHLIEAEGAVPA